MLDVPGTFSRNVGRMVEGYNQRHGFLYPTRKPLEVRRVADFIRTNPRDFAMQSPRVCIMGMGNYLFTGSNREDYQVPEIGSRMGYSAPAAYGIFHGQWANLDLYNITPSMAVDFLEHSASLTSKEVNEVQEQSSYRTHCKYCWQQNLRWWWDDDTGWRLGDDSGTLHDCASHPSRFLGGSIVDMEAFPTDGLRRVEYER